jgi:hypothetical protein
MPVHEALLLPATVQALGAAIPRLYLGWKNLHYVVIVNSNIIENHATKTKLSLDSVIADGH